MNAHTALPRTTCPSCAQPLKWWPRNWILYHCHACQRPLARYPASLTPRIYRIVPLFPVLRAVSTVISVVVLTGLLVTSASTSAIVWVVAIQLALFGATDAAEGYISVRTGIAPRRGKLETGSRAKTIGWVSAVFGGVTCFVAALGLIIARVA